MLIILKGNLTILITVMLVYHREPSGAVCDNFFQVLTVIVGCVVQARLRLLALTCTILHHMLFIMNTLACHISYTDSNSYNNLLVKGSNRSCKSFYDGHVITSSIIVWDHVQVIVFNWMQARYVYFIMRPHVLFDYLISTDPIVSFLINQPCVGAVRVYTSMSCLFWSR